MKQPISTYLPKRPQVILLGNGINRAFNGESWNDLLNSIAIEKYKNKKIDCPMPLKAILVTGDHIDKTLKNHIIQHREQAYGKIAQDEHMETLQKILSIGADHILTTNYSYELEMAAKSEKEELSDNEITKMMAHTDAVDKAESKYLLSTYNQVQYEDKLNCIWHIHGEARKPSSVILGHYYYGVLINKLIKYTSDLENKYANCINQGRYWKFRSWIDAFILGDVYILGYKLDLSEFDLWWLINRKKNENAEHGDIYFYEPIVERKDANTDSENIDARLELIKVFVKDVKDMGVTISPKEIVGEQEVSCKYREFYKKAIDDIKENIVKNMEATNV